MDDDTIEIWLGPGTMPGTEDTLELPLLPVISQEPVLPVVEVPEGIPPCPRVPPLPPELMNDPILDMVPPQQKSAVDTYFPDGLPHIPGRPLKGPRVRITWRDHVLAAMAAGVLVLGTLSYVAVSSGWRSGMPQQARPVQTVMVTVTVTPSPDPGTPQPSRTSMPSPSPVMHRAVPHGPVRPRHTLAPPVMPSAPAVSPRRPSSSVSAPPTSSTSSTPSWSPEPSPSPSPSPSASGTSTGTPSPEPVDSSLPPDTSTPPGSPAP